MDFAAPKTPRRSGTSVLLGPASANAGSGAAPAPPSQQQQQQVLATVGAGIVLLLLVLFVTTQSREHAQRVPRLRSIMTNAAQWSAVAAQDSSPLVRLLHVVYAMGNLNAARTIATDPDIQTAIGYELEPFAVSLQEQQAAAIRALGALCPSLRVAPGLASMMAGWNLESEGPPPPQTEQQLT